MARIYGDAFDNDLTGTNRRDRLFGELGNDTLSGDTNGDKIGRAHV